VLYSGRATAGAFEGTSFDGEMTERPGGMSTVLDDDLAVSRRGPGCVSVHGLLASASLPR
jgi:hypothetical protein